MNGTSILEKILYSLEEASRFRVNTFREIIGSQHPRVRRIIEAEAVLGIVEFEPDDVGTDCLIGKKVDCKSDDNFYEEPETSVHLYKVTNRLRGKSSHIRPLVFKDTHHSHKEISGIFEASFAFDSVCRDFDQRFTDELKPSVKYSVITPAIKIEFPVYRGWRGNQYNLPRATNGTAIVRAPFSITPNSEMSNVIEFYRKQNNSPSYLADAGFYFEQGARVIKAVEECGEFHELTNHFVHLSKRMDEKQNEEHIAHLGRQ